MSFRDLYLHYRNYMRKNLILGLSHHNIFTVLFFVMDTFCSTLLHIHINLRHSTLI